MSSLSSALTIRIQRKVPLGQGLARNVIDAFILRRVELHVVGTAGRGMNPAAGNTFDHGQLSGEETEHSVDFLAIAFHHFVEFLGLVDGTGEPVQNHAFGALGPY